LLTAALTALTAWWVRVRFAPLVRWAVGGISRRVVTVSTLVGMSEPARDLPVGSPAVERAVELARRGVITHLTVHGERVAAIVPESVIEAIRAAEDAEDAAEADVAMDEPGESIPWEQVKAELDL
jgi:antitoxin Phd